jgi:hypothetical protein
MSKPVRVLFINCPSLAVEAAAFLILAQNQAQTALQFEVEHFWIYAGKDISHGSWRERLLEAREDGFYRRPIARLKRKYRSSIERKAAPGFSKELSNSTWEEPAKKAISDHDDWLSTTYLKKKPRDVTVPTMIVTEAPLKGGYLSYARGDVGVISIANWQKYFSPASGLEFMLTAIQRQALWISYRATGVGSHYPTRGCVWDFHGYQPDSRISAFLGFICKDCRTKLTSSISPSEYDELEKLLANKWIGSDEKGATIARTLRKNYGYYLSRSSGLRPGLIAPVTESVKAESGKAIADIGKWAIILLITLLALTYFPEVTKKLKEFFSGTAATVSPAPTASPSPTPIAEPIPAPSGENAEG